MTTRVIPYLITTRRFVLGSKQLTPLICHNNYSTSINTDNHSMQLYRSKENRLANEYLSSNVLASDYYPELLLTNGLVLYGWENLSIIKIKQLVAKNPYFNIKSPHYYDMWNQLRTIGYLHNRQDIINFCDVYEVL